MIFSHRAHHQAVHAAERRRTAPPCPGCGLPLAWHELSQWWACAWCWPDRHLVLAEDIACAPRWRVRLFRWIGQL